MLANLLSQFLCCSKGNELHVDLNATFEVGTVLDIPKIVELFQGHLIDTYWLPDPEGNKLYKLDFSNTTIAGKTFFQQIYYVITYMQVSYVMPSYVSTFNKIIELQYCQNEV